MKPVAWHRWSEHLQKWFFTHEEPTELLAWIPLIEQEQKCYCGDIYRLGVIHRENTFCDEHPQEKPQCPDCGAAAMYECVACGSSNYPKK